MNRNRPEYREPEPPPAKTDAPINHEAILALHDYRALRFAGRAYRVPPLTYTQGVAIQHLHVRMQELEDLPEDERLTDSATERYEYFMGDIVRVCGPLLLPCGLRKHFRHFLPNPLRNATEIELRAVLDFLAFCRTMPHVRLQLVTDPGHGST